MPGFLRVILIVAVVVAVLAVLFVLVRRRMHAAGIFVRRGKFGPVLVFTVEGDDGRPVRVLNVGGMYQSATYLEDDRIYELVFEYTKLYDKMFEARPAGAEGPAGETAAPRTVRNVLMLGGGGYSYPKHLIATHPEARIDVVEVDPVITDLAWKHFFLDRLFAEFDLEQTGRLGLICEDGRAFLEARARELAAHAVSGAAEGGERAGDEERKLGSSGATGTADVGTAPAGPRPYDAVLIDTFSGKDPVPSLVTVEAARAVKGCLAPGGLYMANIVSALEGRKGRLLRSMVRTLGEVFAHVYVIPCATDEYADCDNTMVVASDGAYEFPGGFDATRVGAGPSDPVPTDACNPVGELVE